MTIDQERLMNKLVKTVKGDNCLTIIERKGSWVITTSPEATGKIILDSLGMWHVVPAEEKTQ